MLRNGYVLFFLFSVVLINTAFPQDNSVTLKDSTGALISKYNSITAAYNALANPLEKSYIIELLPEYTGSAETIPITFTNRGNEATAYTVTIRPAAGNTGEIISGGASGPIVQFDDADYIIFDGRPGGIGNTADMKIQNTIANALAHTIRLQNGSCFNTFRYCQLLNSAAANAGPRTIEFGSSASNVTGNSYNLVDKCVFIGGRSCVASSGTAANPNVDNKVMNCEMYNFGYAALWLLSAYKDFTLENCTIYQTQGINSSLVFGINVAGTVNGGVLNFRKNKIYNIQSTSTSTSLLVRGIYGSIPEGTTVNIENNFISLPLDNNNGTVYGIHLVGTTACRTNIFYNSIRVAGAHTGGTSGALGSACIYKANTGAGSVHMQKNNICVNERSGGTSGVIHAGSAHEGIIFPMDVDYNLYYATGSGSQHAGWGTAYFSDISAYKAMASPYESHTVFHSVSFTSITDLHLSGSSNGDNNLAGLPVANITTDIDNQPRSTTIPYKGADEGTIPLSAGPALTWHAVISLIDHGNLTQALDFGGAPTATDGLDTAYGEAALGAIPPAGTFDARFKLPVTSEIYSLKDFRPDTVSSAEWLIKFQPGPQGYPYELTWSPAALPEGSFILKDVVNGTTVNVDMKTNNGYTLTNTNINTLKIVFNHQMSSQVQLGAGWNMISVPLNASNMNASVLFSGANSQVFGYDNGYLAQTTLALGKGYWVRYASATNVSITGMPSATDSIHVNAGWNMIGGYHFQSPVSSITSIPAGIINSNFFSYNSGYTTATMLEPGKGYWVRTSAEGTLKLGPLPSAKTQAGINYNANSGKIIISDALGSRGTLTLVSSASEISADLPPVPPAGAFDVRFTSGKNIESASAANTVEIHGAVYPILIKADGVTLKLKDRATNGRLFSLTLKPGSSAAINDQNLTSLTVEAELMPEVFALYQNYPNPFNPATKIKYRLAASGSNSNISESIPVRIVVYDILGREKAVLVNEIQKPGAYEITFDGSDLNSGVYFYSLKAGKFSDTKKFLLLK